MRTRVAASRTLILSGPASLELIDGKASALGARLKNGLRLIVRKERQIPIEFIQDSIVDIWTGADARCEEVAGSTTNIWRSTLETIAHMGQGLIVILGGVDTGKSTLCMYLANNLIEQGHTVAVIDTDPGQSDIGPSGTIGLSIPDQPAVSLSSVKPRLLWFIGYTNPSSAAHKIMVGVKRLLQNVPSEIQYVLVNTDGWIEGYDAVNYKSELIQGLDPTYVIGLERSEELNPLLDSLRLPHLRLRCSPFVRGRSRDERKALRESNYRVHLDHARVITLSPLDVDLRIPILLLGRTLMPCELDNLARSLGGEVLYGKETESSLNLIVRGTAYRPANITPNQNLGKAVSLFDFSTIKNSLVGLLDRNGFLLGIGILKDLDGRKDHLSIYSPMTEAFSAVEVGSIKLSEDGMELN